LWSRVLVSPTSNIDRVPGLRELQDACPAANRITIAVIDGPADLSHPALEGADVVEVSDRIGPSRHVDASRLHGTHVASVLFGQPGGPVVGIVPACRGLLIPVFTDAEDGDVRPCSEIEMARAILSAVRHGANLINVSAGRMSGPGTAGMHLSDAIRLCAQSGVLVVAAAGNDGCDCHQVPAALPEVLAVGAMDGRGDPVGFSNWGAAYRKRGVLAPGIDILGAEAGGGTIAMSGTSFSTPIVSGVAALLMAGQIERGGKPDGRAVLAAILDGADACDLALRGNCERHLAGTLNVAGAFRRITGDTPAQTRAATAFQSTLHGLGQRSAVMDEQHGDVSIAPEGNAAHASIEALAASLRAMEGLMGELSRTLGSLRPSSVTAAAQGESVAPSTRIEAEPLPPRSDVALRPSARHSLLRASPPRHGERLLPAACCDACAASEARQLVYALGRLGYDFGTEARMDSIQSQMNAFAAQYRDRYPNGLRATVPADLVTFLKGPEWPGAVSMTESVAAAITWTLNLNDTPIYAIQPEGYYVAQTYRHLVNTLDEQVRTAEAARLVEAANKAALDKDPKARPKAVPAVVERMSLPGMIIGQVELMNGIVVPTVRPALAGMFTWSLEALVQALSAMSTTGVANDPGKTGTFNPLDGLRTFLARIYEEMRNVGLAPQDRALNYAATNAFQVNEIFAKIRGRNIHIEKFEVIRSPVMRPDSDCWDVKMTFYSPEAPNAHPREVYFYTIDVSDVVPVAIGTPRHWTTF